MNELRAVGSTLDDVPFVQPAGLSSALGQNAADARQLARTANGSAGSLYAPVERIASSETWGHTVTACLDACPVPQAGIAVYPDAVMCHLIAAGTCNLLRSQIGWTFAHAGQESVL